MFSLKGKAYIRLRGLLIGIFCFKILLNQEILVNSTQGFSAFCLNSLN